MNTENEKTESRQASKAKNILSIFQSHTVIVVLLGFLFLFLSYVLEEHKDVSSLVLALVAHLFRDIGIAFLIAAIVAVTIERWHKEAIHEQLNGFFDKSSKQSDMAIQSLIVSAKETIDVVGTNFIQAAYGKSMPPELFTVVEESIFKADFIRSSIVIWAELNDLTASYLEVIQGDIKKIFEPFFEYYENCKELENGDGRSGCIEELVAVRTSLSYKVKNVSDKAKPFHGLLEVDVPFAGCVKDIQGVKPISVGVNNIEQITGDVENSFDIDSQDKTKVIFKWKPVEIKPDEVIDIKILLYSIRRKRDQEMWSFRDPSEGIEIGVEDCNGDKEIYLELMVPSFLLKETNAQKNSKTNIAWLKTEKFLLPYQGVKIKWKPKVDVCPIPIAKINS